MRSAATVLGFKDGCHVRRAVAIAVLHDEFGTAEDADERGKPDEEARLFKHLTHGRVRRDFSRLYRATRQEPDAALGVTRQQDASVRIA